MNRFVVTAGLSLATWSGIALAQSPPERNPSDPNSAAEKAPPKAPPTPAAHVESKEEPESAAPSSGADMPATATDSAGSPSTGNPSAPESAGPRAPDRAPAVAPRYGLVYPANAYPPPAYGEPVRDVEHKKLGPLDSHINLALNIDTVWYTKKSFDFFSDHDNATAPGVSVGYAIWIGEAVSIVPEIGWGTTSQSASGLFGGSISRTELGAERAYAGASVRYGLLSFLEAHARVAGGASFLHATVTPASPIGALEDSGTSPFVSFGGGVTVHTPAGALETQGGALRSVIAGVTFEGGYELGGSIDLTPTPTGDTGRVATESMSLGTLERSGPYFRSSLVVRF